MWHPDWMEPATGRAVIAAGIVAAHETTVQSVAHFGRDLEESDSVMRAPRPPRETRAHREGPEGVARPHILVDRREFPASGRSLCGAARGRAHEGAGGSPAHPRADCTGRSGSGKTARNQTRPERRTTDPTARGTSHCGAPSSAISPDPGFEGSGIKTKAFEFFDPECEYTDDSVCTAAVADILLHDRPPAATLQRWCRRHPGRGYGGLFASWIES